MTVFATKTRRFEFELAPGRRPDTESAMKIRLLTENLVSDLCWLAEWGFSAWIEYDEMRILFDAGWSGRLVP